MWTTRTCFTLILDVVMVLGEVFVVDMDNDIRQSGPTVADGTVSGRTKERFPKLVDMLNAEANLTDANLMTYSNSSFDVSSCIHFLEYFVNVCRAVSRGEIETILGNVNCDEMRTLSSMENGSRTPFVNEAQSACAASERGCSGYFCHVNAGVTDVGRVFAELVKFHKWTAVNVLYDDSAVTVRSLQVDSILHALHDAGVTISLFQVHEYDITPTLSIIVKMGERHLPIVLLCRNDIIVDILVKAVDFNLRRMNQFWLLYGDDRTKTEVTSLLKMADNIGLVTVGMGIPDSIENTTCITHDCNGTHTADYVIYSSVKRGYNDTPDMNVVGMWSQSGSLRMRDDLFPNSKSNFRNRLFTVTSLEYSIFQTRTPLDNGDVKWEGITFDLLDVLARDLNFRYRVVEPPDGQWGGLTDNNTWNGMIGLVARQEVDFAAVSAFTTYSRKQVVDFPEPYFRDSISILIQRPRETIETLSFMRPLTHMVWVTILASILFGGVVLWFVSRISRHNQESLDTMSRQHDALVNLHNALWLIFGANVLQGGSWVPTSYSGRMIFGTFLITSVCIVATYTSNLVAFFTVTTFHLPFNTLDEMIKQSAVRWATVEGISLYFFLKNSKNDPFKSVADGLKTVANYQEGLELVQDNGKMALLAEKGWFEGIQDCNLTMTSEEFFVNDVAFALPKHSWYTAIFSERIRRYRESGLLNRWVKKWQPKAQCLGFGPITSTSTVTMKHFHGSFLLLAVGVSIAAFALLAEQLFQRVVQRHRSVSIVEDGKTFETTDLQTYFSYGPKPDF